MISDVGCVSILAPTMTRYLEFKRALGCSYAVETTVLMSLDAFLASNAALDLSEASFIAWCRTFDHVASGVRRNRMRIARNLCLYRRRNEPGCFVPDLLLFPAQHQALRPYIFSDGEVAALLHAARKLEPTPISPLRPRVFRLAIVLLYTMGLRRGELLRMTFGDHDVREQTLLVRESKFHKSRLLPMAVDVAGEVEEYVEARRMRGLSITPDTPLIGNRRQGGRPYTGTELTRVVRALMKVAAVHKPDGRPPRIHDFRHSFAVNALLRWYRSGAMLDAKLPLLATYMGHVSIASTQHYLHFVEPIAAAANERFAQRYANQPRVARTCGTRRPSMKAPQPTALARCLRAFLGDHLPRQRGLSPHTVLSYRDSLALLLRFLVDHARKGVTDLELTDVGADEVIAFLQHLEQHRRSTASTRNVRLAAIHAFFRFVATQDPQRLEQCQRILGVPFKRFRTRPVEYLEHEELTAVLAAIDRSCPDGRRDHALLVTMFNTGARVQELLDLRARDLQLVRPYQVRLFGKGRKERICPLWPDTAQLLVELCSERGIDLQSATPLFVNRWGQPLTRFGVRYILGKYFDRARAGLPSLAKKRLHPHSMRHSSAVHMLKAGVDLVTISQWLGHASVNTTNRYATIDLDMKRDFSARENGPGSAHENGPGMRRDLAAGG